MIESLNPITHAVLIIIAIFILMAADLIVTNITMLQAKEEKNIEEKNKLKSALTEKLNFALVGISVLLGYYVINFSIFLFGHFYRNI